MSLGRVAFVIDYVVRGIVALCALACVALPLTVMVVRIAMSDRYRIDGPHGASVVVRFDDTPSFHLVGYSPQEDGVYRPFLAPLIFVPGLPPTVWFILARRRGIPVRDRWDRAFRLLCAACPWFWLLAIMVIEPAGFVVCILPAVGIVAAGLWLWQMGIAAMGWKARAERARKRGVCWSCGYDLRATPHRCPECGQRAGLPSLRNS